MSIAAPQPARRVDVRTGHTYAIPVVRELPRPAPALDAGWCAPRRAGLWLARRQRSRVGCGVAMEFSILGPLEVRAEAQLLALGGTKPRALLAVLLLHANQPVSFERLAVALWGEDAPAGAVKTLQVHAARLRGALGQPDVLSTTPAGYRLRVEPEELDAEHFERLVASGRDALAVGAAERAA